MWYTEDRWETDGACGEIREEIGMDAWDRLRREGASDGVRSFLLRPDVRDCVLAGVLPRLAQEPVLEAFC